MASRFVREVTRVRIGVDAGGFDDLHHDFPAWICGTNYMTTAFERDEDPLLFSVFGDCLQSCDGIWADLGGEGSVIQHYARTPEFGGVINPLFREVDGLQPKHWIRR